MPYTVTEPHPTVQANAYTHSGRGGLGNTFRAPTTVTPAAGVPTPLTKVNSASSSAHTSNRFYAGRGGAGNAYPVSVRRDVSLDDEYAYAAAVAKATTSGHVGRGGAGNVFSSSLKKDNSPHISTADKIAHSMKIGSARKSSDASSSSGASMSSEDGRVHSGFWGRMHR